MFRNSILCCILCFANLSLGQTSTPSKEQWLQWKKKQYDKFLNEPTSFLNAYALKSITKGRRLYLNTTSDKRTTGWQTQAKGGVASIRNQGTDALVVRPGAKDQTVSAKRRRFHWTLTNGAIAEAVYGSSSNKVWAYLYDPEQIKKFTGFRFYPFDPKAIVKGVWNSWARSKPISYRTVQGDSREVFQVGEVTATLRGKSLNFKAYNWQDPEEELKYVALIFTDLTGGVETYGGGRELIVPFDKPLKDKSPMVLDFNRTNNFYCAHSPFWHCPVGLQQKVDVAVKAGEMNPLKKISHR